MTVFKDRMLLHIASRLYTHILLECECVLILINIFATSHISTFVVVVVVENKEAICHANIKTDSVCKIPCGNRGVPRTYTKCFNVTLLSQIQYAMQGTGLLGHTHFSHTSPNPTASYKIRSLKKQHYHAIAMPCPETESVQSSKLKLKHFPQSNKSKHRQSR